jgi:thiol-disulfide isomerase/thioredoxin
MSSYKMSLPVGGEDSSNFMSRIKSAGSGFTASTFVYIAIAVILIIISVGVYYQFVKPALNPSYTANREKMPEGSGVDGSSKNVELLFFYVDWCPHCKTAKPDWEELKSEYENKTINGYHVKFTEINCTEESTEIVDLINKYNIEGYPTVKLLKDGQIIEYDAKPSKDTLTQFLNSVL